MTENQSKQQLIRLNTVTDVVYGITIWRFFDIIPKPKMVSFGIQELNSYISENFMILLVSLVGILVTSIYWIQNNTLSSTLKGSDARHSALRLVQLFFLMLFLYSMKFGVDNGSSLISRLFESGAAFFMGFFAGSGFIYAIKKHRLVLEGVTHSDTRQLSIIIIAEPVTALFTLFFIHSQWLWELSWLSYPIIKKLMIILAAKLKDRQVSAPDNYPDNTG